MRPAHLVLAVAAIAASCASPEQKAQQAMIGSINSMGFHCAPDIKERAVGDVVETLASGELFLVCPSEVRTSKIDSTQIPAWREFSMRVNEATYWNRFSLKKNELWIKNPSIEMVSDADIMGTKWSLLCRDRIRKARTDNRQLSMVNQALKGSVDTAHIHVGGTLGVKLDSYLPSLIVGD